MKVALLHYWLTNIRGGEKVFLELCEMFPDADIFTHVISSEIKGTYFPARKVYTSFINNLAYAEKLYKNYMPLMFMATRTFDLTGYDLIISSESGPVKGIKKPEARHVCYCHTPMRYLWDMFDDYYKAAPLYKKWAMKLLKNYLRQQDLLSAESVDAFIVNSEFVKERVKRIYNRDAKVIYPPVEVEFFQQRTNDFQNDCYLLAGELVQYKRPDIAIKAFNANGKKLVVAGAGEELNALKLIARSNITFTGRISDEKMRELYSNAIALIFPGIEDFGIVPLEAQATGTPVIAYGCGGALETIIDNKTGLFFPEQTSESLNMAINKFENTKTTFDSEKIKLHTQSFAKSRFAAEIKKYLLCDQMEG
ncbi:MAG: glycosyltransferase [Victivallaceae bacterium]